MADRYKATVRAVFEVEFEDNGELVLVDQAHDEAASVIDENRMLHTEIVDIERSPA